MEPRVSSAVKEKARKVTMKLSIDQDLVTLETLADVIAHSQIIVEKPADRATRLPAGFDATDVAILDWIVAEARRTVRGCALM
jgi:hypothetical protein